MALQEAKTHHQQPLEVTFFELSLTDSIRYEEDLYLSNITNFHIIYEKIISKVILI